MFDQRRLKRTVMLLVLAALSGAAIPALEAQTLKGTLLGTITDSSQAVVSGVNVSITEINTNVHRTEMSNQEGFYVFANLDPGNYRIEAEHPGFRKVVRTDIDLTPNTTARIDLELTPEPSRKQSTSPPKRHSCRPIGPTRAPRSKRNN